MMDLPAKQATHQLQDPHIERKDIAREKIILRGCRLVAANFRTQKRLQHQEGNFNSQYDTSKRNNFFNTVSDYIKREYRTPFGKKEIMQENTRGKCPYYLQRHYH